MLKRTISLSLLCMVSHAYSANIIVTTTADENGNNPNACSLREAIQLINGEKIKDAADPNKEIYKDLLNSTQGFGGCGGKSSVSDIVYDPIIELPFGKTYLLEKEIVIQRSMTLRSDDVGNSRDRLGVNNPVIRAVGKHRLFNINDVSTELTSIQSVSFEQINLEGCNILDKNISCESNGGIISNNENLTLSRLRIKGGSAQQFGGAIYSTTPQASVTLKTVDIQNNRASNGSALSFEQPNFNISESYFQKNSVISNAQGVLLHVREPLQQNSLNNIPVDIVTLQSGLVLDSTFYQNDSGITDLREGMIFNNTTLVENRFGIRLMAPKAGANVANSIIAANKEFDCQFTIGDQSYLNNNMFIKGCDEVPSLLQRDQLKISGTGETILFADQVNGQCAKPPARGLLCRPLVIEATPPDLQSEDEFFNPYLRPRLLTEYASLNDSKIVNKGLNTNSFDRAKLCTLNDQRGLQRDLCDIGAIELVIDSNRKSNGLDIRFGETARLDLLPLLGDGDLIPAEVCPQIFPNRQPANGTWLEGCLTYVTPPKKGALLLEQNGEILYRPNTNFQGVDRFSYDVVTTTSRFSQGLNDQTINIETTIVQEPLAGDSNRKVDLAGGAFGWFSILSLLAITIIARRSSQK